MSIVQAYKSQVRFGATKLFPAVLGGSSFNWPLNQVAPPIAGNYWLLNKKEGLQVPQLDIQFAVLDVEDAAHGCPLNPTWLNAVFMTRSADYQHDIATITGGMFFFDGFSGFNFDGTTNKCKGAGFSISGSKGDDVRLNASFMAYGTSPTVTTTPPDASYPYFTGAPVRFQSLSFKKNGTYFDGFMSFDITFSNNMTPDLSMVGSGPQDPLPRDCNAGMQTVAASFTFQADSTAYLAAGDDVSVIIEGLTISGTPTTVTLKLNNINPDDTKNRNIGTGRQVRRYTSLNLGDSNSVPPLVIT